MVTPSQAATKDGATLAYTGAPPESRARAAGRSSRTSLAFWGQATKHRPQRMHSSGTMLAWWSENRMDLTGQLRIHL